MTGAMAEEQQIQKVNSNFSGGFWGAQTIKTVKGGDVTMNLSCSKKKGGGGGVKGV